MGLFSSLGRSQADNPRFSRMCSSSHAIRREGSDFLVQEWSPERAGFSVSEAAVLEVDDGYVAVVARQGGSERERRYVEGPFYGPIEDILQRLSPANPYATGLFRSKVRTDTFDVYFVNAENPIDVTFGIPYFAVPSATDARRTTEVAVRGRMTVRMENYHEFLEMHGLTACSAADLRAKTAPALYPCVKRTVLEASERLGVAAQLLDSHLDELGGSVGDELAYPFVRDFGVFLTSVDITDVETEIEG